MRLRKLFEFVGDHFGIAVEVITTDGRQPIGHGIGPVLEARDVMAVLDQRPDAPADLREKSLRLAAHLLEYDPQLRGGTGYARARELLDSGAALKQCRGSSTRRALGLPHRRRHADLRRRRATTTARFPRSTACSSTASPGPPARRSTRAPASGCSRRSATASSRASRSTASMPMTSRNSILPRLPRAGLRFTIGEWHAAPAGRRRDHGHHSVACRRRCATPPGSLRSSAFPFARSPSMRFPTARYG